MVSFILLNSKLDALKGSTGTDPRVLEILEDIIDYLEEIENSRE